MSEPIPESIPTSFDRRSHRPTKRRALSPVSAQAATLTALFAKPDREIHIPKPGAPRALPPPPEIVANVQGSSAGAGSGEFHVYKAARRREYERIRLMEEEVRREAEEKAFREKVDETKKRDAAKTEKNRRRRRKQKEGKAAASTAASKDTEMTEVEKKECDLGAPDGIHQNNIAEEDGPVVEGGGLIIHDEDD
ncbi:DUF1168-domain-containing protein [Choiromyces venosus 120613-1]|uniref:DUF1168-domain-containing protein n=1 Tax=Choiromyces venosus 120613-1 TaxID=1336337 RepID=A0A3N4J8L1_9PEZI|nr:DUF1168-domain-containing protein [Choiromyces venosus 120613-1]